MNNNPFKTYLHKHLSQLGRILIIACGVFGLVINILSFTISWDAMSIPCKESDTSCTGYTLEQSEALASIGISLNMLNKLNVGVAVALNLVYFTVAGLILWRRPDSGIGLLTALWFVMVGPAAYSGDYNALIIQYPALRFPTAFLNAASIALFIPFLFFFPNGHFFPGWSRWPVLVVMPFALIGSSLYGLNKALSVFGSIISVLAILAGLVAQIVRYRKYATSRERQQTKLIVFGVALFAVILTSLFTGIMISHSLSIRTQAFIIASIIFLLPIGLLAVPFSIGISLLRYRLWDIDLIIRRTLQYAILTSLLSLVYFGGVALLQALLSGVEAQSSPIIIVLTTLLIAALFNPLRNRIQEFIDRHFYRQKYDAELALAKFADTARSQTDLQTLTGSMSEVVQTTLQPEAVSVWLLPYGFKRKSQE